jgi:hypothetical protein
MRKVILLRRVVLLLFIGVYGSAAGEAASVPTGQWVLSLGQRTMLILSITSSSAADQVISGSLSQPRRFQTDGWSFFHIQGGIKIEPIVASSWKGDMISLTVQNPANPSDKDTFLFTLKDRTHAQLRADGVPILIFDLIRAQYKPSVATDWDETKTYSPDDRDVVNGDYHSVSGSEWLRDLDIARFAGRASSSMHLRSSVVIGRVNRVGFGRTSCVSYSTAHQIAVRSVRSDLPLTCITKLLQCNENP